MIGTCIIYKLKHECDCQKGWTGKFCEFQTCDDWDECGEKC